VRFGFIIIIQIALMITAWFRSLWKESGLTGVPLLVILVSTYAIILSLGVDNAKILD
jgi:hypothetical protein